ncbi:CRISPR-associated endonuclease Cas2 [Patescibacteria group bacterium]|nr:CRISPR-associated endonuclease Cas2 [Patescibacteria group bacterium]MBU4057679.1 CRISPR-associated endonuclease Cas2 [Patescibacteria group bacterium]MBU4116076.1 CRISPR-associated endonuclease Cas2 [Patescibacteria group bacterium]
MRKTEKFLKLKDLYFREEEKVNSKNIILRIIGAVGIITIAVLAPNAVQVFDQFLGGGNRRRKYYIKNKMIELRDKGLIEIENRNGIKVARLTEKGNMELINKQVLGKKYWKPNRWDGKWRIIIFDIKEKRKQTRDKLRKQLLNIGFVKLQNSVWAYPYDCEDIVALMKANLKIGKDVLYLVVEKIESDEKLRDFFGLNKYK